MPRFPRRKELSVLDLPESSDRSFRERLMAQQKPSKNVTTPRHRYYWWDRYNVVDTAALSLEGALRGLFVQRTPDKFGFVQGMERRAAADRERLRRQEEVEARGERGMPKISRPHMNSEPSEQDILSWIFFAQTMGGQGTAEHTR